MSTPPARPPQGRRRMLTAGGAVGALAAAAAALPLVQPDPARRGEAAPESAQALSGYRLTEHVQRYYRTAKV